VHQAHCSPFICVVCSQCSVCLYSFPSSWAVLNHIVFDHSLLPLNPFNSVFLHTAVHNKGKGSPNTQNERRVPELMPFLGSQPAGDRSHKPSSRLPLLSTRPAVTSPATCWGGNCDNINVNSYCSVSPSHIVGFLTGHLYDVDTSPLCDHCVTSLVSFPHYASKVHQKVFICKGGGVRTCYSHGSDSDFSAKILQQTSKDVSFQVTKLKICEIKCQSVFTPFPRNYCFVTFFATAHRKFSSKTVFQWQYLTVNDFNHQQSLCSD